ncbi:MAG TPA: insulinase family protein, partial [Bacteroidales bacterium]|nr:insulinase family protein [Bacteroidales bacterium]
MEQLFEQYRSATDQSQKMKIYKEIDEVSQQAATYVATNEYDKLMSAIGAKSTNAGTSYESTVYMNDVPVNELERWAILESERFHDIVLRLFHTELETVYEEFNMYQDMDSERAFDALMSELFAGHPYGRSVIGLPDHIKNPSMVNIKKFFETYYVPNNIAIAMSGDIDFEKTIQLVDRYFGDLKYRELPQPKKYDLQALHGTVVKEVVGPEAENVMLAFRTGGVGTDDQMYCTLIDLLLSNSQAGLIDLDLVQQQKVLSASTYFYAFKEHGIHVFQGEPLQGQSLEDVKNLFLAELEKIKKGEFDDWLVQAVINDTKLSRIKNQEGNMNRAFELMNEFIDGLSREQALNYYVKLEKLTKEDIVRFANEKYSNNYVVVNKRQGQNSQLVKVDKPEITPVPINRQLQSDFSRDFLARQTADVEPVFLDFDSKIHQREIQP